MSNGITTLERNGFSHAITINKRELELLKLYASGYNDTQITAMTKRSRSTVKRRAAAAFEKLGAINRINAVALAIQQGMIKVE